MVSGFPSDTRSREALESADRETQSVPTLLHRLTHELASLFRRELTLFSAELTQTLGRTLAAVTITAAGGLVLFVGVLALVAAAVLGLSELMAAWLAALLVGLVVSVAGITALAVGARRVPENMKPKRTARSLAKDRDVLTRKTP
jgi:VIT1/CCC1 family predicted Fe2+/Mn2+ transporter